MKNKIQTTVLCTILATSSITPVLAADDIYVSRPHANLSSKLYIGAGIGYAVYDTMDDSSAGFSIYGGYHINEVLAVDVGWTDLGDVTNTGSDAEVSAFYVDILGKLPLGTDLTAFGKLGLAKWDYEGTQGSSTDSDSDVDVLFGLGLDYDVSGKSAVRFGVDFYSMEPTLFNVKQADEDIMFFSVGFVYKL